MGEGGGGGGGFVPKEHLATSGTFLVVTSWGWVGAIGI